MESSECYGDSLGHWWLWYDYSDFGRVGQHATAEMTAGQTQLDLDGLLSVRLHCQLPTRYRSREYADASMRPRLEVTMSIALGFILGTLS